MLTGDPDDNVAQLLWRHARRHPDRPCLTDLDSPEGARTLSYGELTARVAGLAGGLRDAGIRAGDRVAVLLRNSVEFVETFLAVAAVGAVVVPFNVRLREDDFRHMLVDSGSRLLVTEAGHLDAAPTLREVPGLRVVLVDTDGGLDPLRAGPIDEPAEPPEGGLLSLMYTSGTTGAPKAVMLTHRSWRAVAATAMSVLGFASDDVVLHVAPLTHGAGFMLLPTLAAGGHNLLCGSYDAARTARLLHSAKVTGLFLVPSMIRMFLDELDEDWQIREGFRWLYYAGSPIDQSTLREATAAFDGHVVQSFAQMESPMFLTVLDSADHLRALRNPDSPVIRSAGRVLPGVELSIVDPDGTPLPPGSDGEVVARAPQMMAGYWGRAKETAATLADGWLHTGDIGHLDEDGYLHVVDRLKDMIVTGGSNVYAREVEEVLLTISRIGDAAVIGTPDRIWGEAVTAVLVPDGRPPADDQIIEACRRKLPGYRIPKRIIWVAELPRNAYGKILKRELRERYSTPGR
ncbi:class I adenylate-forming enzyme family protein [Amycolatopsis pigmentata]|uniref:Class I adenylate-forming enzyme family protein n=1 Tax=Amycolatopsis pigmentata TaxID=450801 RepID=A0ABW5FRT3_9PSEU